MVLIFFFFLFFFNDTATTEIYTLSLHVALPISAHVRSGNALGIWNQLRLAGRTGGTGERGDAGGIFSAAHLRAAGDDGHVLQRSGGKAGAGGGASTAAGGWEFCRTAAAADEAGEVLQRRRRPLLDGGGLLEVRADGAERRDVRRQEDSAGRDAGGDESQPDRRDEDRGVEEHDSAVDQESRSLAGFARQVWMGIRNQQPGGGRRARGGVAGMGRHL